MCVLVHSCGTLVTFLYTPVALSISLSIFVSFLCNSCVILVSFVCHSCVSLVSSLCHFLTCCPYWGCRFPQFSPGLSVKKSTEVRVALKRSITEVHESPTASEYSNPHKGMVPSPPPFTHTCDTKPNNKSKRYQHAIPFLIPRHLQHIIYRSKEDLRKQ